MIVHDILAGRLIGAWLNLTVLVSAIAPFDSHLGVTFGFTRSTLGVYAAQTVDIVVSRQSSADRWSCSSHGDFHSMIGSWKNTFPFEGVILGTLLIENPSVSGFINLEFSATC